MNRELEEIKSIVIIHFGALGFLNPSENEQILKDRDKVLNALTELQSLKEANPSEVLKCFEKLGKYELKQDFLVEDLIVYDTIKQTLIKAQENEKVLEIIEEKDVDTYILKNCNTVDEYNSSIVHIIGETRELTEEEFVLLKR